MSDTTIRLDSAVRDKLRALADEDHVTLGDLLSRLAEREQYQREMGKDALLERTDKYMAAHTNEGVTCDLGARHKGQGHLLQGRPWISQGVMQ